MYLFRETTVNGIVVNSSHESHKLTKRSIGLDMVEDSVQYCFREDFAYLHAIHNLHKPPQMG